MIRSERGNNNVPETQIEPQSKIPPRNPRELPNANLNVTESSAESETEIESEIETDNTLSFADLGLTPVTLAALERMGYNSPSPIQGGLIPPALEGRDCLGNAPTGTGKTAAFLIPLLEKIEDKDRRPQALILAPTRELVHQIGMEFDKLCRGRTTRAVGLVGGESIVNQIRQLQFGAHILIATPGRLMDLMARNRVRLDKIKVVVLDEADQMLDVGFQPAIDAILEAVPAPRQTLLLSATMPPPVRKLAQTYLKDPVDVRLISENEDATIPAIRQAYVMVHHHDKFDLLVKLLEKEQPPRAIIFCRTKRGADEIGFALRGAGLRADTMHGNLSQAQRNRVLNSFRTGRLTTLVATDVVGRGIDVRGISHVINFDLPEDPAQYVHRIGRTGRMGNDGVAFSFVVPEQSRLLDQIERTISRQLEDHYVDGIESPARMIFRRPERFGYGRGGPRRGGRPPYRGGGRGNGGGGGGGPRHRRDREPQGAGR